MKKKIINIQIFSDIQKVNESKITCQQCDFKNKGNCPKNELYRCLTCSKNICLLCKDEHNNHENIYFKNIMPNKEDIKQKIEELKKI